MVYLLENDTTNIVEDTLLRKEFYQYDLPDIYENHDKINNSIIQLNPFVEANTQTCLY